MNASEKLIKALMVAMEITGTELSDGAVKVMLSDLSGYPEPQVLAAIKRCCRELRSKLTLADILNRMDDGRPTPEEAWSMIPKDEAASVVWTEEMSAAFGAAAPLLKSRDHVAARMAFLERYKVLTQQARDARKAVHWSCSLGMDKNGRELALLDAAEKGRLSVQAVQGLLPYHREEEGLNARLLDIAHQSVKRLGAPA